VRGELAPAPGLSVDLASLSEVLPQFDDQICRLLRTTSRFEPGRNAAGKPVTATFQSRVAF
jgi:hypothetical protein